MTFGFMSVNQDPFQHDGEERVSENPETCDCARRPVLRQRLVHGLGRLFVDLGTKLKKVGHGQ